MNPREEWRLSKSNVICQLIGACNCPGDENGAYPDTAICFLAEALIDKLTQEYATRVCEHDWIDIRNKHVESGSLCRKCNLLRRENVD